MKKFTKVMALLLALSMVLAFAACGGNTEETTVAGGEETTVADVAYDLTKEGDYTADNTEYVIGATGPLTGDAASYGISVQQGAQLAVEEINKAGGLNGVNFKFDMKDDKATAPDASTGYDALYEAGMQASLGSVTSGSAESFVTRADEDGVFALTPSASADNVINASNNAFRVCFGDPDNGIMSAEKLAKEYEKIGAIYDSSDAYSEGIYAAFKAKMAELNVTYIEQSFDAENNRDFSTQVEALKDCDVIFLPIYYQEASLIIKEISKDSAWNPAYFGCDGMDGIVKHNATDEDMTAAINGLTYLTPFDVNDTDEKVKHFVDAYKAKYNETPDQFAADAYDAIYVIYEAMKKAEITDPSIDPSDLCDAITGVIKGDFKYKGVTGEMTWAESGAATKPPKVVKVDTAE